jgi:predicted nuclease with TOPRIM domain
MKTVTTMSTIEKRYNEWLENLSAFNEHLQRMESVSAQLQSSVNDLHFQQELRDIRNEIVLQKNIVSVLSEEVLQLKRRFNERDDQQIITLSELIENNRFRDKVLKAAESVFMLKYQINKFLSIAS